MLSPFELLERLVALIPSPKKNQIRYHGFLGPNAALRKELLPRVEPNAGAKICRANFAKLMKHVFEIDVLECPRCFSRVQIISFVREARAISNILKSLKMSTAPPEVFSSAGYALCYEEAEQMIYDAP